MNELSKQAISKNWNSKTNSTPKNDTTTKAKAAEAGRTTPNDRAGLRRYIKSIGRPVCHYIIVGLKSFRKFPSISQTNLVKF
jgi:hypothetical protein